MLVSIRRSGGCAGLELEVASIDSGALSAAEAQRLRDGIDELSSWVRSHAAARGADQLQYDLSIIREAGAPPEHLTLLDDGNPAAPPMKWLEELIRLGVREG